MIIETDKHVKSGYVISLIIILFFYNFIPQHEID
jgi:hypothetical protein